MAWDEEEDTTTYKVIMDSRARIKDPFNLAVCQINLTILKLNQRRSTNPRTLGQLSLCQSKRLSSLPNLRYLGMRARGGE